MTTNNAVSGVQSLDVPARHAGESASLAQALEALAAQASGAPAASVIAQLANQFFHALPGGQAAPATSSASDLVLPSAQAPLQTTTAPAQGYVPTHTTVQSIPQASSLPPVSPRTPTSLGGSAGTLNAVDFQSVPRTLSSVLSFARPLPETPSAQPANPLPGNHTYFADDAIGAAAAKNTPFRFDFLSLPPESVSISPSRVPAFEQTPRPFDPHAIRRDFPILQEQVHGKRLVWLDNGATTQKPQSVIDRLSYYYEHENSNVHRGAHTLAARATDAYEAAREKVRRFINAASAHEIIFVRGTTEGINLVAQSWGRQHINAGDEIVVTHLEHHANIVPWQQLIAEKGARLRVAPLDDNGQIILEEYEKLLNPRTKLVAITAVSNALGTITPAQIMTAAAHRHGACVLIDGAQAVSHMPVDVQSLDADFYVFSGHKVFAPTGIGVVYGKKAVLDATQPWQGGGNMIADVTFERTVFQPAPFKFEAGTGNIADAVGLGAAIDYISAIGMPAIAAYEHNLLEYATAGLRTVPGLKLYGTAREKAGVLSFTLDGVIVQEVGTALDREGIAVRAGHHCAQPILRRFGVEGTVRASLAPYNTCEDIDALVAALLNVRQNHKRV